MPNGTRRKWLYALLTGALVSSQLHFGPLYATPEIALLIGNLFAFAVTTGRYKQQIRLVRSQTIGTGLREYVFAGSRPFSFRPGQYMELTLPHHSTDGRGNRRTFSIASESGSTELRFATKLFEKSSSFKTELERLGAGDVVTVGQLNGSFVLPDDHQQKLVWIAGGIGVTPFVGMAREMIRTKQTRDVTLFYLVSNAGEYAYQDVWKAAHQYGIRVIPILTSPVADPSWKGLSGTLTAELITQHVPDVAQRQVYLSGPHGLVVAFKGILQGMDVPARSIHTDYFSGY